MSWSDLSWHAAQQLDDSFQRHLGELDASLQKHAQALVQASDASAKYARSLTRATWVLAVATAVLAVATIALVAVTVRVR